ncbi:hypothetical protein ACFWXK_08975 [Streptomyces sp. NPDC059070]|uniref:hypothetical protein n=1 Tax=unclassified Streptomyces TaxID=2593676 RepID=UPI0034E27CB0
MTEPQPRPPEPPGGPDEQTAATPAVASKGRRGGRVGRLVRHGRARWVALGVVVLLGGGLAVAAVAAHDHHHGRAWARHAFEDRGRYFGGGPGEDRAGPQRHPGGPGGQERGAPGRGPFGGGAPVPLPALSAAQAVDKATAAVPGGKVESLRVVAQQGGGSAWQAVVLGTDGVRHAVTLSGTDGAVTGNTVVGDPRTTG